jgi:branched-chain amino acid transport system permease protein
VVGAALGVGLFALIFERLFMSRVYSADVLLQLLVCYAFILILDDAVKIIWGAEFLSMGMPAAFQKPPILLAGGVLPVFYLFLIVITLGVAAALAYVITQTRIGKIVRAAAINPTMTSALGINTALVFGGVFALGGLLAGLAGALAVPVRSMVAGMGFSIRSIVHRTVIGGMGSVAGALVGALLIGLVRSFGTIGFPLFTEGLMFVFMTAILIIRPSGLFGKER